ncbi:MAG: hypothetical protein H6741_01425 [Alphaproteobacteria bacterium]|nr:hypothetical protein [Alphaproteobacteria bacterium]
MNARTLGTCLALLTLTACVGAKVQPLDSAEPSDDFIQLADAPPERLAARVHGDGGGFLRELEMTGEDTWAANLASGVLSIAVNQGTTQVQITLWQSFEVDDVWPIEPADGGGLPQNATLTFIDEGMGGQATAGELEITAWRRTDSPQIMLMDAVFEAAPILNPDQPDWTRELREGALEAVRVTAL